MARPHTKKDSENPTPKAATRGIFFALLAFVVLGAIAYFFIYSDAAATEYISAIKPAPHLDIAAYDAKLLQLAHLASTTPFTNSTTTAALEQIGTSTLPLWPTPAAYPEVGALLPFNRIVAYYGNFYSAQMGVLGEQPPAQTIAMLASTSAQWAAADPTTPVIPAIDYIAYVAQGTPGADGYYSLGMPDSQIDQALSMANQMHGLLILDVQVGGNTIENEVPTLAKYLAMPNVELALDPEFDMHNGAKPDSVIGSMDASDINWAAQYLATLVKQDNLPPKILVVHRFTDDMITNSNEIVPLPSVQVVIDMDGWGSQAKKINTYQREEETQPVQFTGFKLFYKNDLRPPSTGLMTPTQVLNLTPSPSFIQYQ
jgi:hypothetical protein